jgi:hypothetical protein
VTKELPPKTPKKDPEMVFGMVNVTSTEAREVKSSEKKETIKSALLPLMKEDKRTDELLLKPVKREDETPAARIYAEVS